MITRRQFITASALALASLAVPEVVVAPSEKQADPADDQELSYKSVEGWGRLPQGLEFGWGAGIAVDCQDRVYVHTRTRPAVVVFDRQGNYLRCWGDEFAGGYGLCRCNDGEIDCLFFSDQSRHMVVKTDLSGNVLMRIGCVEGVSSTAIRFPLNQPTSAAVAPSGDVYVAEGFGGNWIHVFSSRGEYKMTLGSPGHGAGQFCCPHGLYITVGEDHPELYVADRGNSRIQVFGLDGRYKGTLAGSLSLPCAVVQSGQHLFVADLDRQIVVLDQRGQIARVVGGQSDGGDERLAPHAICSDSFGDLYIVERKRGACVRKYRRQSTQRTFSLRGGFTDERA